ncbi:hypothetical protein MVEN_01260400 [Mycena venus]|uniref:Uncharacterized protein n=1 Tax=Mycena venus TaxID=2733690 RepID=A0A8H7CYU7_9AGAR|nr:hypothetical protein MVEN_01260400 [Mycena venus]
MTLFALARYVLPVIIYPSPADTHSAAPDQSSARARSAGTRPNQKNPIGEWYSTILPAMFPISLLASAVYTTLLLGQLHLSHEKTMEEQAARLVELEAEVDALHRARNSPL